MSQPSASAGWRCSECGAESYWPSSPRCWLCGGTVLMRAGEEDAVPAVVLEESPADRRAASQVAISTILMLLTLTAVLVGVFIMAPGLGIVLFFFTLPAVILSGFVLAKQRRWGGKAGIAQRIGVFFLSFGFIVVLAVAMVIAAIVALFIVCLAAAGPATFK